MSLPNFINFEPFNALRRKMHTDRMGNFDFEPDVPDRGPEKPLKKTARKVKAKLKTKVKTVASKVVKAKRSATDSKAKKGGRRGKKEQA